MGRDDPYDDDIDWLDVDSAGAPARRVPPRWPWPRGWTLVAIAAVVAVVVGILNLSRGDPGRSSATAPSTPASSTPVPATSASSTAPGPPATTQPSLPAVSVTRLGRPLLNTTAGWELFGRGPGVLVRIEPAAGRITRTTIPDLLSGGPVYLVAGSDRVIVRPLDNVPGYVVRDGRPAVQLPPVLNVNGPVFPGPSPDRMWVRPADDHQPVMALTTLDGRRLAEYLPVPDGSSSFEAVADGGGYLLYPGIGGVYDARPDGLRRISTGSLLAAGPTGWLAVECDERYRCRTVLIDRANGSKQTVVDGTASRDWRGVIAPDGSTAAVATSGPDGAVGLALIDLVHHRVQRVPGVSVSQETLNGALAFSPDSAWLFAVTADGAVSVVNPRTAAVRPLAVSLPVLSQLVVRPARPAARPTALVRGTALAADRALAADKALTKTCCRPTPEQ